jgi:hypothetical protein
MNILFDINHPAQVHFFKHFIKYFKNNHHRVIITTREKDITSVLMKDLGWDFISLSRCRKSYVGMLYELLIRDIKIFLLHFKYKFDLAFGSSISIAHLSFLTNVKSYNFTEDDDCIVPFYKWLTYPFTTKIINPTCLKYSGFVNKRIFHNSYQKLAYLHPDIFKPDINIINKYNLKPHQYVVVRLSALLAHHDAGAKGINVGMVDKLTKVLKGYEIVYSRENDKRHMIDPLDMHHVLAYAKMIITDSLSMAVEGSVLGVPTVRYNSFEDKHSVLRETEDKYKLAFGFDSNRADSCDLMLSKIEELLKVDGLNQIWQQKKAVLLKDKVNLTAWLIEFFEKELNKDKK